MTVGSNIHLKSDLPCQASLAKFDAANEPFSKDEFTSFVASEGKPVVRGWEKAKSAWCKHGFWDAFLSLSLSAREDVDV